MRIFSLIFCLVLIFSPVNAEAIEEDKKALLEFFINSNFSVPLSLLRWNKTSSVCHRWIGVTCSRDGDRIIAVRLPGFGFNGQISPFTISRISSLRILSLRRNHLTGEFPSDFINLKNLTHLYLQHNQFSGSLPENLSVLKELRVLDLSNNEFSGRIPISLSGLTRLEVLNLANNSFSGKIPDLNLPNLKRINRKHKAPVRLNEIVFLSIVAAACVACMVITCCLRTRRGSKIRVSGRLQKGEESSPENWVSGDEESEGKIIFFGGNNSTIHLDDLLRASAEVLGKGNFSTSYKTVIDDISTVVVKRLKEVVVGIREFEQQMEITGTIKHENVTELKAYYYSKDNKLVVYSYHNHGSLLEMLHGNRGEDHVPLDWDARLRIAIGVARGLDRIHVANNGKFVHGNIKSSNIFINSQNYGCIGDLGLTPIMRSLPQSTCRSSGYHAPEIIDTRRSTQFSDVYSFGVVLLELLTGKSPVSDGSRGENMHLANWIRSVVSEEWTGEVFDMELLRYNGVEEEMVEMLQIGLACVDVKPEKRPKMADVLKMIEEIRPFDAE